MKNIQLSMGEEALIIKLNVDKSRLLDENSEVSYPEVEKIEDYIDEHGVGRKSEFARTLLAKIGW